MADKITVIPELFGELTVVEGKHWVVVYTKPRREKKLAEYAFESNINYYLPLIDSPKIYERKKVLYKKPMFSSYIFVRVDHNDRKELLISGHTVSFINVKDEKWFLEELISINKVRETGAEVTAHHYIEEGVRVKFKEGPLEGVIGYVTDAKNIKKVVLQVNILRRAIAVTAETNILELLPDEDEDEYDE